MATTATERQTAASNNPLQRLILSLSLSTASKVIVKQHARGRCKQQPHRAGGGAFRCRTCGRAFPTFQALGGHRTSHKRPLVRAHGLHLLLGARPGKGAAAAAASDVHRCTTCGAVFPTGQALGGHMCTTRVVVNALSSGEQGDREDDDARSIRLFKFI